MIDARTIAELEVAGFTHVKAFCDDCGATVQNPFRLLRASKNVDDGTTMATIRRRYTCQRCGCRAASSFEPWRQG